MKILSPKSPPSPNQKYKFNIKTLSCKAEDLEIFSPGSQLCSSNKPAICQPLHGCFEGGKCTTDYFSFWRNKLIVQKKLQYWVKKKVEKCFYWPVKLITPSFQNHSASVMFLFWPLLVALSLGTCTWPSCVSLVCYKGSCLWQRLFCLLFLQQK